MSKNFELLQKQMQLEHNSGLDFFSAAMTQRNILRASQVEKNAYARIMLYEPESASCGDYLEFADRLFNSLKPQRSKAVVFAAIGSAGGYDTSRFCVRLAESIAIDKQASVCLVDYDFRSRVPSVIRELESPNSGNKGNPVPCKGEATRDYASPIREGKLYALPWSAFVSDSESELVPQEKLAERLAELKQMFDFVFLVLPPLHPSDDGRALWEMVDGLVLILELNLIEKKLALEVLRELRHDQIRVLGAVVVQGIQPASR